jgi:hypothetical protein
MKFLGSVVIASGLALLGGCKTGGPDEPKEAVKPPAIAYNMPLDQALKAGIDFGGDTLLDVRKLLKRRKEAAKAAPLLRQAILEGLDSAENMQLMNATALYMGTPEPLQPEMFEKMLQSGRPLACELAWQIAAVKPSKVAAKAVERELTRALADSDEESLLYPQMANAVAANNLKSSYTLLRRGLMVKGDEEYAQAMIKLEPEKSSNDFLPYLAQANAEELRQLTMSSVNVYTVIAILKHMQRHPADLGANGFEHLFEYAVSRNTALAELAQAVIQNYIPKYTDQIAQKLATHPLWVQIAYVENARRSMTPKVGLLLNELKESTAEPDVVEEIGEVKF